MTHHTTSRRAVIAGIAALPLAASAAGASPSVESGSFAARVQAWHELHDRLDAAYEESSRLCKALGKAPATPARLKAPISAGNASRVPKDAVWTAAELDQYISRGGVREMDQIVEDNAILSSWTLQKFTPAELAKVKRLRSLAADYERRWRDRMEAIDAIEKVPHDQYGREAWEDGIDLLTVPATSLSDLALKTGVARRLHLIPVMYPAGAEKSPEDRVTEALLQDIERMTGGKA
jgi:hypothetical protein